MTSNNEDATIPNTANHDADRDPIASLLDRLPVDAALVRRAAFTRLRATAAPVDAVTLAVECDLTVHEGEAALTDLVSAGTITRSPGGAVVAAGGLSVAPTEHRLRLGGHQFWTWCAFDGIGIPATLEVDAVVETRCPTCDRALVVQVEAGHPPADSPVVGWLPGGPCGNVQADFCPEANLFCDARHLAAWRATGDHEGATGSLAELADHRKGDMGRPHLNHRRHWNIGGRPTAPHSRLTALTRVRCCTGERSRGHRRRHPTRPGTVLVLRPAPPSRGDGAPGCPPRGDGLPRLRPLPEPARSHARRTHNTDARRPPHHPGRTRPSDGPEPAREPIPRLGVSCGSG